MSFGTKGWRKIVVDGRLYFWQRGEAESLELFRVRPEREAQRLLRVTCGQCGPDSGFLRGATPGVVRGAIECATRAAWPEERSKLRLVAFSNPTRYVGPQPNWLTSSVLALAQGIAADRAFDRLPILADALQDAGCDNEDVLNHCRATAATHIGGCWVVDLLLGKE